MSIVGLVLLVVGIVGAATASNAAEGRWEINQACAAVGCFPGHSGGFPIVLAVRGSYVLTSSLSVSSGDAISVTASKVTLDLNGFSIVGPGTCSGSPPTCSGSGGRGINATAEKLTVMNGRITGFGTAIRSPGDSRFEDLDISEMSAHGIFITSLQGPFEVRNSRFAVIVALPILSFTSSTAAAVVEGNIFDNTPVPIFSDGVSYSHNIFEASPLLPPSHGRPVGPNLCDSFVCGGENRLYYAANPAKGADAESACLSGFHIASMYELRHTAALRYGGLGNLDSGFGPPAGMDAWVRSGSDVPSDSCDGWTSNLTTGYVARLEEAATEWTMTLQSCGTDMRVWCVQD